MREAQQNQNMVADKIIDLSKKKRSKKKSRTPNKLKMLATPLLIILCFCFGILSVLIYLKIFGKKDPETAAIEETSEEGPDEPYLSDKPIHSPLNGVTIPETDYEKLVNHIPHAVMISNNKSARDEQYGLNYADIVYEAETEGGITRFMAIFWTNQKDFMIKPVRSVRKYFLDWAIEYGNIPVSFTGFALTDNYNTNAWGFYKEENIRVTYFDWPFQWDDECLATHPSMHCKRTTPEALYKIFEDHGWTYESWEGFSRDSEWKFEGIEKANTENTPSSEYETVTEFSYDFTAENDWTSRWVYNESTGLYEKHDPVNPHVDMQNGKAISASTVILAKMKRIYTGDDEGRIIYENVGSGDAFLIKNGQKIPAIWKKECHKCRMRLFSIPHIWDKEEIEESYELSFKPGLIWIAAVPNDQKVRWN